MLGRFFSRQARCDFGLVHEHGRELLRHVRQTRTLCGRVHVDEVVQAYRQLCRDRGWRETDGRLVVAAAVLHLTNTIQMLPEATSDPLSPEILDKDDVERSGGRVASNDCTGIVDTALATDAIPILPVVEHARIFLEHLREQYVTGIVLSARLESLYRCMCADRGIQPLAWSIVAPELKLPRKKRGSRGRQRRAYELPALKPTIVELRPSRSCLHPVTRPSSAR